MHLPPVRSSRRSPLRPRVVAAALSEREATERWRKGLRRTQGETNLPARPRRRNPNSGFTITARTACGHGEENSSHERACTAVQRLELCKEMLTLIRPGCRETPALRTMSVFGLREEGEIELGEHARTRLLVQSAPRVQHHRLANIYA